MEMEWTKSITRLIDLQFKQVAWNVNMLCGGGQFQCCDNPDYGGSEWQAVPTNQRLVSSSHHRCPFLSYPSWIAKSVTAFSRSCLFILLPSQQIQIRERPVGSTLMITTQVVRWRTTEDYHPGLDIPTWFLVLWGICRVSQFPVFQAPWLRLYSPYPRRASQTFHY